MRQLYIFCLSLFLLTLCSSPLQARPKYLFKVGSLAPAGSVWITQFDEFASEISEKTDGEVGFRNYPGGVMGDDKAMYRKMRVGQLHGGGFTMSGISAVVPDFRVMSIPFLYTSYEEVDFVKEGLIATFRERFHDKGLELIGMTEVGFLYAMSIKPIKSVQDLRQSANWSPSGDPISEEFLTALNITPVQLSIPDVLSSLQSGLIETVYNSLYGSIVMQWFTKARYIVDHPYGYAYGVFALDRKKFAKLPAHYQEIVHAAAKIHFPLLLAETRRSNKESRGVLEQQQGEFISVDADTLHILRKRRDISVKQLVPGAISLEIYEQAATLLENYKSAQQ